MRRVERVTNNHTVSTSKMFSVDCRYKSANGWSEKITFGNRSSSSR